jgi:hypothetical protein
MEIRVYLNEKRGIVIEIPQFNTKLELSNKEVLELQQLISKAKFDWHDKWKVPFDEAECKL